MNMLAVHTVPVWDDPEHLYHRRPPLPGETRKDLKVVGWCNVAVVEGLDTKPRFIVLVKNDRVVYDEPPVGEF